jgi:cysteine sulfinate desulfinase/cysteine desulfurase-like protein
MLAQAGIYSNTGSACASKALKTAPVLGAIGIRADLAQGSTVHCSNLGADALAKAIENYENKQLDRNGENWCRKA